jgi:hypothetical protein
MLKGSKDCRLSAPAIFGPALQPLIGLSSGRRGLVVVSAAGRRRKSDHDRQSEGWHVAVRHQRKRDPVHGDERLDLHGRDSRALDADPGFERCVDRARRRLAAPFVKPDDGGSENCRFIR